MQYTALQIASYFLAGPSSGARFGELTHLKLQKLVYYTKVWSIIDGADIVADAFVRWKHGPVCQDMYSVLRSHGKEPIAISPVSDVMLDERSARIADVIMYTYGRLGAFELSDLSHTEDPWLKALADDMIGADVITNYYSQHPFARNFPLDREKPFYPLLTQSSYAYSLDMGDGDRCSARVYPSFDEYRRIVDLAIGVGDKLYRT